MRRIGINKKVTAIVLAGLLSLGTVMPAGATGTTDAEIDKAKKEAEQLEEQKKAAEEEKNQLSAQLNGIIVTMQETSKKIDAKSAEIEQAEIDYVNAKVDEDRQYQNMKKRIRFMYENGDSELIELLLTSQSIVEMLNKAEYITKISEYDRKMLDEFKEIVAEVKEREESLQADYEKLGALQEELGAQQKHVESLLAGKGLEIANLESAIGAKAEELRTLIQKAKEEEEARRRAEEAKREEEARREEEAKREEEAQKPSGGNENNSESSKPSGGNDSSVNVRFTHPCPSGYLTSGFGYRDFDNSFHNGVDFGTGGAAAPTYAAASGRVLIAGWSNSAGNWVVISHGNGLVTKYMHHSSLSVSAGQTVSKGQKIGMTGNTGNSAGVHLHFQVELNGKPVNPFNYL